MIDIRTDPRLAGEVSRYHTWPHIRQQSIAEHSWQVMRVLLAIYPMASRGLLIHCMNHDAGEIGTGDIPYPIKKENPELKKIMDNLESETIGVMASKWNFPVPALLSPEEKIVFKIAEFIEMWEWALKEQLLGNKFAEVVASRCLEEAFSLCRKISQDIAELAQRYIVTRTTEWPLSEH